MLINRIYIEEYGILRHFEVDFGASKLYNSQLNLSVIVGDNGTGKTSLLKFIAEVFTSDKITGNFFLEYTINNESKTISNNVDNIKHNLKPKKVIVSSYSTFEQFKTDHKMRDSETLSDLNAKFENRSQYVYAGPKKKFNSASLSSIYLPILKNYLLSGIKKSVAIQELLREIGYTKEPLIQLKRMRVMRRIDQKQHYANEGLIEIAYRVDEFNNKFSNMIHTNFGHQRKKLIDLRILQEYSGGVDQWIEDVQKLEKIGINVIEDLWFPKEFGLIPMKSFSSGELSMFFRFFKLIDNITDTSIVLIDEPETHLHPRWIQKYIKMLNDIFGHYDCHIIIATHSPLIVSDVASECIVGLKQNNNIIEKYRVQEQTLGIGYREILNEVFGVDDLNSQYTKKLYEDIMKLLENGELSSAKELYSNLGDSELKFDLFLKFKEYENRG